MDVNLRFNINYTPQLTFILKKKLIKIKYESIIRDNIHQCLDKHTT